MTDIHFAPDDLIDFADVAAVNAAGRRPTGPLHPFDLYRDIHKGIRTELFAITTTAGNVDPHDDLGRAALAAHVLDVAGVLDTHAEHEDAHIDAVLREVDADLAGRVRSEHLELEAAFAVASDVARAAVEAEVGSRRSLLQLLHLQLSGFTSAYLRHQLVEERVIMPMLADALGPDAVLAIHGAIVGSIPPDEMARSLAFMLPAMNADDRAELLGGMRESAPPEAFAGVVDLARSVLDPTEAGRTFARLGL